MQTGTHLYGAEAIKTSKERIAKQLEELWQYTQQIAKEELKDTEPTHYKSLDPEEVRKTVEQIDEALKDTPSLTEGKAKGKICEKELAGKTERIPAERRTFGKTQQLFQD